jgi:hypothetical protein
MFKMISAGALAICVLAAPALAANPGATTPAPVSNSAEMQPSVRNANAGMSHHVRHFRHHRRHRHMGALKSPHLAKVSIKRAGPSIKRG